MWTRSTVVAPTGLHGANGMQLGPDGKVYIASSFANKVSVYDPATSIVSVPSDCRDDLRGPDDVAFSRNGDMFITEPLAGRVDVRRANGSIDIVSTSLPAANGLTVWRDRLFISECRSDGRILEQPIEGGSPRLLAEHMAFPNAMAVGPDGWLYYPVAGVQAIWRLNIDGPALAEEFVGDVGRPSSVKFDWNGNLVYTDSFSGRVVCVDLKTRGRIVLAQLAPGLDNTAIVGKSILVSNFLHSSIHRIDTGGTHSVVADGLVGPYGLAALPDGGVAIADGLGLAVMHSGQPEHVANWHTRGYPGFLRSLVADPGARGVFVTTSAGTVARYDWRTNEKKVLASGLDELMGMTIDAFGDLIIAEAGAGRVIQVHPQDGSVRVISQGLSRPTDVAVTPSGRILCCESGQGRVIDLADNSIVLQCGEPHSLAVMGDAIAVTDASARTLVLLPFDGGAAELIAEDLPVRTHSDESEIPGNEVVPGPLPGFADLEVLADGSLLLGGNANGSIYAFRQSSP